MVVPLDGAKVVRKLSGLPQVTLGGAIIPGVASGRSDDAVEGFVVKL